MLEADGVFPSSSSMGARGCEADAAAQMKKSKDEAREELVNRYWHVG